MPTHLKQHVNRLCSMAEDSRANEHCKLRHHHYAMVCRKGRCLSMGKNRLYCSLRSSDGRERRKEKQKDTYRPCRVRRYHSRPRQPPAPTPHILPNRNPIPPKFKLCRHVKTVREL